MTNEEYTVHPSAFLCRYNNVKLRVVIRTIYSGPGPQKSSTKINCFMQNPGLGLTSIDVLNRVIISIKKNSADWFIDESSKTKHFVIPRG